MKLGRGIELLDEVLGEGPEAGKGAVVTYNARFFLPRGDEITRDGEIVARAGVQVRTRRIDGVVLIDQVTELGRRRVIAGVEKALQGMRAGGYREVLVAPRLAYGTRGVENLVAPDAMLRIRLWVQDVAEADRRRPRPKR
jgi:peptidylprolyl isomerase